jgi:hypothetical protein
MYNPLANTRRRSDYYKIALFPVNAHQVDICTPVSLQSCGGRMMIALISVYTRIVLERDRL